MTGSEIYLILATIGSGLACIIAFITVAICRLGYQRELEELSDEIVEIEKRTKALQIIITAQQRKERK